jgi:hypothetical protein
MFFTPVSSHCREMNSNTFYQHANDGLNLAHVDNPAGSKQPTLGEMKPQRILFPRSRMDNDRSVKQPAAFSSRKENPFTDGLSDLLREEGYCRRGCREAPPSPSSAVINYSVILADLEMPAGRASFNRPIVEDRNLYSHVAPWRRGQRRSTAPWGALLFDQAVGFAEVNQRIQRFFTGQSLIKI